MAQQALFKRAKCMAMSGDINGALNELRKFAVDPLRRAASQAVLQLAIIWLAMNRVPETLDVLSKNREYLEAMLAKDPANGPAHSLHCCAIIKRSLCESGKLRKPGPSSKVCSKWECNAPKRRKRRTDIGQCFKEEGVLRLEAAHKLEPRQKRQKKAKCTKSSTKAINRFAMRWRISKVRPSRSRPTPLYKKFDAVCFTKPPGGLASSAAM